jgi:putative transposase
LGRSRGGLTTKLHAAVDRRGRLLKLLATAGQCGDAPQADGLLEGLKPGTVGHVVADAAYDSDAIRQRVKTLRAKACIRPNPTRKRKKRYDPRRYKNRNVIERFFSRIKRCRRVATRYEKKAVNFTGFVWLAAFVTQ